MDVGGCGGDGDLGAGEGGVPYCANTLPPIQSPFSARAIILEDTGTRLFLQAVKLMVIHNVLA